MTLHGRRVVMGLTVFALAGCATNSLLFHSGPRPAELAGIWIDVEKTTAADTSAWVLAPGGDDLTLHLKVRAGGAGPSSVERGEKRYASWYLAGAMSDTAGRAL